MTEEPQELDHRVLKELDRPIAGDLDSPVLGELGRAAYLSGGFLLLLVFLISSDDFFRQWGLGLLGGVAVTLGYAFLAARNTLKRRQERKGLEDGEGAEGPGVVEDRWERTGDYAFDFLTAGVLLFLAKWMYPAATILIDMDRALEGLALILASGVFGATGLFSLGEGIRRFVEHRRAGRELRAGSGDDQALEAGPADLAGEEGVLLSRPVDQP